MQDLTAKLSVAEENWKNLCRSSQWIANLLRMPEDEGKSWGQFASLIPVRLQDFLKEAAHACVKNIFFLISGFLLHRLLSKSLLKKLRAKNTWTRSSRWSLKLKAWLDSLSSRWICSSLLQMMKLEHCCTFVWSGCNKQCFLICVYMSRLRPSFCFFVAPFCLVFCPFGQNLSSRLCTVFPSSFSLIPRVA